MGLTEEKKLYKVSSDKVEMNVRDEDLLNAVLADLVLGRDYDNGVVTYPNTITEVYEFRQATTVIATVTLVYTDSTKEDLSTWTYS